MRPIQLDYVSSRIPSMLGLAIFALAFILVISCWQFNGSLNQRLLTLNQSIQQLKTATGLKKETPQAQAKSSNELVAKMEEAKKLAAFLMIPWGDVFSALESAALEDAALLSIEPDSKKHQLKISAEAKNKDVMFSYLEKLEATDELTNVYLLKHEILEDMDQHPIRFVAVANWKERP